jgi:hypothetical protein
MQPILTKDGHEVTISPDESTLLFATLIKTSPGSHILQQIKKDAILTAINAFYNKSIEGYS